MSATRSRKTPADKAIAFLLPHYEAEYAEHTAACPLDAADPDKPADTGCRAPGHASFARWLASWGIVDAWNHGWGDTRRRKTVYLSRLGLRADGSQVEPRTYPIVPAEE